MLLDSEIRVPIAISFGAIAGALSRYYLTLWFVQRFGSGFPLGTFVINLTGCFGMGFLVTLFSASSATISPELKLLILTGFLGAYTTFSTYGLESYSLFEKVVTNSRTLSSFIGLSTYWLGSAVLGVISIALGMAIARFMLKLLMVDG
jgi:CrcB protein